MDVKWGDLQSVFQIIVGLNLAYYAFSELRNPSIGRLRKNLEQLEASIDRGVEMIEAERKVNKPSKVPDGFKNISELHRLSLDLIEFRSQISLLEIMLDSAPIERFLGLPALIIGVSGIIMLIISAFKYTSLIPDEILVLSLIIGFLPPLVYVLFNGWIIWVYARDLEPKFSVLQDRYFSAMPWDNVESVTALYQARHILRYKDREGGSR